MGTYREEESTEATLDLLDRIGVNYTLIDEVCCSGVLEDVGYPINESLAKKNIDRILATGAKTVMTGCPYCSRTFNSKPQYGELKEKGIAVIHISQFLKDFDLGVQTAKKVTYHDPCDLGRHCGIYEEPRETIRRIAPNFVETAAQSGSMPCAAAPAAEFGARFPRTRLPWPVAGFRRWRMWAPRWCSRNAIPAFTTWPMQS